MFILNESAIWLVSKESHNMYIHCRISPRRTCKPCGFTMKINSRGHRQLIYIVKRNTVIDSMGPFNIILVCLLDITRGLLFSVLNLLLYSLLFSL